KESILWDVVETLAHDNDEVLLIEGSAKYMDKMDKYFASMITTKQFQMHCHVWNEFCRFVAVHQSRMDQNYFGRVLLEYLLQSFHDQFILHGITQHLCWPFLRAFTILQSSVFNHSNVAPLLPRIMYGSRFEVNSFFGSLLKFTFMPLIKSLRDITTPPVLLEPSENNEPVPSDAVAPSSALSTEPSLPSARAGALQSTPHVSDVNPSVSVSQIPEVHATAQTPPEDANRAENEAEKNGDTNETATGTATAATSGQEGAGQFNRDNSGCPNPLLHAIGYLKSYRQKLIDASRVNENEDEQQWYTRNLIKQCLPRIQTQQYLFRQLYFAGDETLAQWDKQDLHTDTNAGADTGMKHAFELKEQAIVRQNRN
ncbi:hypothetical protein RFI_13165, partial [Reticulomyxa filosa]